MEKNLKKDMFIYIHFAVHLKLTQHCKLTILQKNSKQRNRRDKEEPEWKP